MNSKRNTFNLIQFIMRTAAFVSIFSLCFLVAFAEENNYQFNELVQINYSQGDSAKWQQLVINPSNNQQFFIINNVGQMFLVDDMKNTLPVLDINVDQREDQSPIKLTAIELHPNFALRDQSGYGTFYTAHLEALDEKSSTKRLQDSNNELILKFDAVITEWQFNSINYQKVNLNTKREVLRIAVPDNSMTIKQMSFSPYTKPWNDGFGLLYIALNGQDKWQKPLYSGVLLRINPAKFGLRSFTVPSGNPYLKDSEIKDEIYLLGGQDIKQFIWPDKNSDDLLLSHRYKGKSLLSLAGVQNDWRDNAPDNIIYQGDNSIEDALLYRGRYLPNLRNKLLILTKANQAWFIESLTVKPSVNTTMPIENKPQQEWQFSLAQLANNSDIAFSTNNDDEVLILDKTAGMVFQISQESSAIKTPAEESVTITTTEIQAQATDKITIIFIVIIAIGAVFYFFKRNKLSAKAIVRKQFAQLELSESQQQIGLYHRHKNTPDTIINIADIVLCEVKLNDTLVSVINQKGGHGFDHGKEQDLRAIFAKEQVDKMVVGKVRQISLSFTDIQNKNYIICLYMRKGSDRVTKKSYSVVINDLIDWCWLIATKINPDETKKRKKKPAISSEPIIDSAEQKHNNNSLQNPSNSFVHSSHSQAAINRSAAHEALKAQHSAEEELAQQERVTREANEANESKATVEPLSQKSTIDTELVNALEKLVDLKQQGFLTQEEFTKAKENLLRSLFDK